MRGSKNGGLLALVLGLCAVGLWWIRPWEPRTVLAAHGGERVESNRASEPHDRRRSGTLSQTVHVHERTPAPRTNLAERLAELRGEQTDGRSRILNSRTPKRPEPDPEQWVAEPIDWTIPQKEWRLRVPNTTTEHILTGLKDDHVKWNAMAVASELSRRLKGRVTAKSTRETLELQLVSKSCDSQQRRLIAGLLQSHSLERQGLDAHEPCDALVEFTVETFEAPYRGRGEMFIAGGVSEKKAMRFAFRFMDRMEKGLARKLRTLSAERSFPHAFALAKTGKPEYVHLAAPILIEHLRDNHISDDACMSLEALGNLGESARSWLWASLGKGDEQQDKCLELLIAELKGPAQTADEIEERAELNVVTWKYDNPVRSWRYLKDDNWRGGSMDLPRVRAMELDPRVQVSATKKR